MTSSTVSPAFSPMASTDSVVSTEAICAGAGTSNLTSDMMASLLTDVTLALILFLAPYLTVLLLLQSAGDTAEASYHAEQPRGSCFLSPRHTRRHMVPLYKERFLFTGDRLACDPRHEKLMACRDNCWHSRARQTDSMGKLPALVDRRGAYRHDLPKRAMNGLIAAAARPDRVKLPVPDRAARR